jgi:hypothetical protein
MDFHVLSTHRTSGADSSPLQFISSEQMAYYKAMELIVLAFAASLGALVPGVAEPVQD